jgi:hypothetical protein
MTAFHQLSCTVSPGGLFFTCDDVDCGRRLVVDRERGDLVVIDRGDPDALHRGFVGGVRMPPPRVVPA